jgi:hypothetical protein
MDRMDPAHAGQFDLCQSCSVTSSGYPMIKNSHSPDLLREAKDLIESGMPAWRAATEKMAAALDQRATRKQVAEAVGMSRPWVTQMLKWREAGYAWPTPFGPQSKASRQRAKCQSADARPKAEKFDTQENSAAAAERARTEKAKAEAEQAKSEAQKATAQAIWANAEAARAAAAARAEAAAWAFWKQRDNSNLQKVHSGSRALLVNALGMLGSDQAGERDSAARTAERIRKALGSTWDELVVQATEDDEQGNEFDQDGEGYEPALDEDEEPTS